MQKKSPGLRPGPRDETPSPDAPPRRQGAPVPAQCQANVMSPISSGVARNEVMSIVTHELCVLLRPHLSWTAQGQGGRRATWMDFAAPPAGMLLCILP